MTIHRLFLLMIAMLTLAACQKPPESGEASQAADEVVAVESDIQIYSYGTGYQIGSQMGASPIELDSRALIEGIQDAVNKTDSRIDQQRLKEVSERVQTAMREQMVAEQAKVADTNAQEAAIFMADNATQPNVVTLDNGLQYRVIETGEGEKPKINDTVVANYRGTLVDGTEFDTSYGSEPVTFPLANVIVGWQEGIQLMTVGSKWQLFIPPALAYGPAGSGPIPPNSVLIFEVELLEIVPQG